METKTFDNHPVIMDDIDVRESSDDSSSITMEEQLAKTYGIPRERKPWSTYVKKSCSCSGDKLKRLTLRKIPILAWLPKYNVRENLFSDVIAGLTVGVVHLPQGLAYASLASLPPIYGLYISFFPVLVFILLGTSNHVSIGSYAVVSIMVGNTIVERSAGECSVQNSPPSTIGTTISGYTTFETTAAQETNEACDNRRTQLAIALAMATGLLQILMSISRLGIVTTYLSTHLLSGFTCGAAFHVFTSQVSKLLGIDVERQSGPLALIYTYIEIFQEITTTNWATVIVSACCIVFLVIGKEINRRYHDKLPIVIPWELGVVIFSTIGSYFGDLNGKYGVDIVGTIPTGIQTSVPDFTDVGEVMVDTIAISIVAFATEISLAQLFAEKHSYRVDADQELLALGMGNVVGSFFTCFPSAASLSRSVIWEEAGAKTQITGVFSSLLILLVLFWIGPLFETVPNAALASIIVVNLKGMLRQFEKIPPLWRVSKIDALIWIVTWAAVVLLGVSVGLGVGVLFEIFTVVVRAQVSNGSTIGRVGQNGDYRSTKEYHTQERDDNLIVFQYPGPLIFANKVRFQKQLSRALGFDPALTVSAKKNKKGTIKETPSDGSLTVKNEQFQDKVENHTTENTNENLTNGTAKKSVDLSAISYPQKNITHVILDMSCCPYVDNDGAQIIKKMNTLLSKLDIKLYLASCRSDIRRALFQVCEKNCPPFFVSIDIAIEVAIAEKPNGVSQEAIDLEENEAVAETTAF